MIKKIKRIINEIRENQKQLIYGFLSVDNIERCR
jgi:hypothetical protein